MKNFKLGHSFVMLIIITMLSIVGCQTTDTPTSGSLDITSPVTGSPSVSPRFPPAPPDLPTDPHELGLIHNQCMDWVLTQRPSSVQDLPDLILAYFGNDNVFIREIEAGISAATWKKEPARPEIIRLLQWAQQEKKITDREQTILNRLVDVSFLDISAEELYKQVQNIQRQSEETSWSHEEVLAPIVIEITKASLDWHCNVGTLDFNWGSFGRADLVGAIVGGVMGAAGGAGVGAGPGAVGGGCGASLADCLNQYLNY
jgi:hypothetical protein